MGGIFTGGRGSVDSSRIKRGGRCEGLRVLGRGKRAKKNEIAPILFDLSVYFIFVQLSRQERMLQE